MPTALDCWIPLVGAGCGIATIVMLYYVAAVHLNNLPDTVVTPPISLLACQTELQHRLYQGGFSVTGLLLGYAVLVLFRREFYATIEGYSSMLALASLIGGILAVVGVIGQGLVTLHLDFLQNIKGSDAPGMTSQDILHQQLALVFFVGAALHTYAVCWYAYKQPSRIFSANSRRLKTACVAISLLAMPIAEWYHPTRHISNNKRMVNVIGLTQYLAVGAYILFFGSYSLDLWRLRRMQAEQQHDKKD